MHNSGDKTSEGLNQILEFINAKGDEGELKEIVEKTNPSSAQKQDLPATQD
ncbi:hypothetical protein QNH39_23340 [Neobacillus novalis]|uniref:Uncharacterized protein n=1 Tax=Neobacillus novalis TaxID=220687 RepID=A0AA95SA78_9BACI|nr:hypothetical protein [Neobacillus novalis]WHY85512.1 hypothetical protein QNH39_23340 [Neobacillus novalis]